MEELFPISQVYTWWPSVTSEQIVSQLVETYFDPAKEFWHKERMSRIEAWKYHEQLLEQGNIITVSDGDRLAGYCEMWRVDFSQFGRIICGEPFAAVHENILNGQIAYVANTFIQPEYRDGKVARMLRDRFFEFNQDCTHFAGTARRKKSEPVKVFKRDQIKSLNKEIA